MPLDHSLFLLLDGVFVPGLYRKLQADAVLLFEGTPGCNDDTRDVSPVVLAYSPHDAAQRKALKRCSGWPMVHAIVTNESLQALSARLAAWCVVEADGQHFNFRFADTRRFAGIHQALTAEQRAHLVGPARQWHLVGRNGQWQAALLDLPSLSALPMSSAHEPLDTRLNAQQFAVVVTDSEGDAILTVIEGRSQLVGRTPSQAYTTVARALQVADLLKPALDEAMRIDWCEACLHNNALTAVDDVRALHNLQHWLEDERA